MDDENQMGKGPAVPPRAKEEANRGVTHARKAAEDLRSAAGAMAEEYRERGKEVWDDALHRVRTFQDDSKQYVRENPTKGSLYRARGRFPARFDFPSLRTVDGSPPNVRLRGSLRATHQRCFQVARGRSQL